MRHLFLLVVVAGIMPGQTLPAFEAVDVHVSAPGGSPSGRFSLPDGRMEFYATSVLTFMRIAYNLPNDRISGGPAWIDTEKFDIIAKTAKTVPVATQRLLLQKILADRFGLVVHTEDKPMPVYLLSAGKRVLLKEASGSSGSEAEVRCEPDKDPPTGQTSMTCHGMTMAALAEFLPNVAGNDLPHPMLDKTGLTGRYDFHLNWTPRVVLVATGGDIIFDAVDKQLGLKIEEGKAPIPVLTIDRVNRTPTANLPNISILAAAAPKEFEVATVKPSPPGSGDPGANQQRLSIQQSGRFDASNFLLRDLIAFAWNVQPEMVVNGQKWLESDRFDIVGTGANTGSIDVIRQMVQAVLVDRFKLAVHKEDQTVPVFIMESAKRGIKLKEAGADEVSNCNMSDGANLRTFACTNTTMAQFAERLPSAAIYSLPHPVVDQTELKGAYDFVLSWTPAIAIGQLLPPPSATGDAPAGAITLFEAFDRELGLKIGPGKHPMPVIVVDHVERTPTDN